MCKEIFVSFNFRVMLINTKYTKISTIRKLRYTVYSSYIVLQLPGIVLSEKLEGSILHLTTHKLCGNCSMHALCVKYKLTCCRNSGC